MTPRPLQPQIFPARYARGGALRASALRAEGTLYVSPLTTIAARMVEMHTGCRCSLPACNRGAAHRAANHHRPGTCTLTTCRRGRVAQRSRSRRTTHSKPPSRMVQTRLQQRHSSRCRCRHRRSQKVPTTRSQRDRSAMRPLRSRRASRLQLQPLDQRLRRAAHGRGAAA